jgi:hypothetical protein
VNAKPFAARNTKLDAISTARRTTAKVRGGAVGAPTNRSKKGFKERAIRFVFTLQPPLRRGGLALRNYGAQYTNSRSHGPIVKLPYPTVPRSALTTQVCNARG